MKLETNAPDAVIFLDSDYNRYSLAVLTGALETDIRLPRLDLRFVPDEKTVRRQPVARPDPAAAILNLAQTYQRMVLACSFPTAKMPAMRDLLRRLRSLLLQHDLGHVLIVAGGAHPSGDPVGTLQMGVDVVVIGEGEVTLPRLIERFLHDQAYIDLPGLGVLDAAGRYFYTGQPVPLDISAFPAFALQHGRYCPIEISRGCPHGCRYCQTPFLMGRRMRHRSLDSLMTYVERGWQKGLRVLRFITPSAFAYGSHNGRTVCLEAVEAMLRAVSTVYQRSQIFLGSFPSEIRPEQISRESLRLLQAYCANDNLVLGAQSGSDRLLEAIQRGHTVADVIRAVELAQAAGLRANVDLIFGLPGETAPDQAQTRALIERLTGMGARIHSHAFMPLAGTPFAHCPPGKVDETTRQLIQTLRGKRLEHGEWQQQEQVAAETAELWRENRKRG